MVNICAFVTQTGGFCRIFRLFHWFLMGFLPNFGAVFRGYGGWGLGAAACGGEQVNRGAGEQGKDKKVGK